MYVNVVEGVVNVLGEGERGFLTWGEGFNYSKVNFRVLSIYSLKRRKN
jgi:hypothetical protein